MAMDESRVRPIKKITSWLELKSSAMVESTLPSRAVEDCGPPEEAVNLNTSHCHA